MCGTGLCYLIQVENIVLTAFTAGALQKCQFGFFFVMFVCFFFSSKRLISLLLNFNFLFQQLSILVLILLLVCGIRQRTVALCKIMLDFFCSVLGFLLHFFLLIYQLLKLFAITLRSSIFVLRFSTGNPIC